MTFMTWTEDMSVGLNELDEDHRALIRIINQLAENADDGADGKILRQCLFALTRYAEYHFGREEAVMAACGYPELVDHKEEHKDFTANIHKIAKSFSEISPDAVPTVNQELLDYLKEWLMHHIMIIDRSYQPFVVDKPAARSAARSFKATHVWWQA
ncbi:MAG: bacteriohemerythrin [Pseudomonadota bacterium]